MGNSWEMFLKFCMYYILFNICIWIWDKLYCVILKEDENIVFFG